MAPKNVLNKKNRGFTLIELLLVLALVVALTVAGIAAYQVQLRNFKVDKTALQIQQWLQAGMAFQANCGQWPADSETDSKILKAMTGLIAFSKDECSILDGQIRAYMPPDSESNNPWGQGYQIGPYDGKATPPSAPVTSPQFYVKTHIGPATLENIAAGKMIAGRLPNASSGVDLYHIGKKTGGVFVKAYVNAVPAGGGGHDNSRGFIVDMEIVDNRFGSQHLVEPGPKTWTCPSGMKAVLVNAISSVDGGRLIALGPGGQPNGDKPDAELSKIKLANQDTLFDTTSGTLKWDKMPKRGNSGMIGDKLFDIYNAQNSEWKRDESRSPPGNSPYDKLRNNMLFISACLPDTDPKSAQSTAASSASNNIISRY